MAFPEAGAGAAAVGGCRQGGGLRVMVVGEKATLPACCMVQKISNRNP